MSVIIKGMQMPENCEVCPYAFCHLDTKNCPLVALPEKHGRLIDADALMDGWMDLRHATKYGNETAEQQRHSYSTIMMYEIADEIEDAPTVIEAEDGE